LNAQLKHQKVLQYTFAHSQDIVLSTQRQDKGVKIAFESGIVGAKKNFLQQKIPRSVLA